MPSLNHLDPNSLRTRARAWLAANPGWHTSGSIAAGLGVEPRTPASTLIVRELHRLTRDGVVVSYRPPTLPKRGPGTVYTANPGTAPPPPPATT